MKKIVIGIMFCVYSLNISCASQKPLNFAYFSSDPSSCQSLSLKELLHIKKINQSLASKVYLGVWLFSICGLGYKGAQEPSLLCKLALWAVAGTHCKALQIILGDNEKYMDAVDLCIANKQKPLEIESFNLEFHTALDKIMKNKSECLSFEEKALLLKTSCEKIDEIYQPEYAEEIKERLLLTSKI